MTSSCRVFRPLGSLYSKSYPHTGFTDRKSEIALAEPKLARSMNPTTPTHRRY